MIKEHKKNLGKTNWQLQKQKVILVKYHYLINIYIIITILVIIMILTISLLYYTLFMINISKQDLPALNFQKLKVLDILLKEPISLKV